MEAERTERGADRVLEQKAAPTWVNQNERSTRCSRRFGLAVMERARPAAGERVLDVGCGVGQTELQLAERVGASGSVLGVDISTPMLARASERARAEKLANLRFENADAQTYAFTPNSVDLVFSRFGVMFFIDPAGRVREPGARAAARRALAFVCWQALAQNPGCASPSPRWRSTCLCRRRRRPTRPVRSRSPTPRACAESSSARASAA